MTHATGQNLDQDLLLSWDRIGYIHQVQRGLVFFKTTEFIQHHRFHLITIYFDAQTVIQFVKVFLPLSSGLVSRARFTLLTAS